MLPELFMTTALLASVSLLALTVTGRPILSDPIDLTPASSTFQTSAQAAFRIHPGKDDLASDAVGFHSQKPKQQIEYLSELGKGDVAAITSFGISPEGHPVFDALPDEIPDGQDALDPNNECDEAHPASPEPVVNELQDAPTDGPPSAPLAVLAFSCIAAFLALACIALTLYVVKSFHSQMLALRTAWELLPRFRRRPMSQEDASAATKWRVSGGGCLPLQTECPLDVEEQTAQRREPHPADKHLYYDAASDTESEWNDVDEKYEDALDMTPHPLIHDFPPDDNVSHPSHFGDPPLPPFSNPLDQPSVDRSTPLMRELCPSPVARPTWSVCTIDSPSLGLSSCRGGDVDITPQPLVHPRRRAYRAIPELDIALAMQLRPGFGIGADSAWMVRFLMAIFGWFAVALTGNAR